MKLYVVRHCQTKDNASFMVRGISTGGVLTERGKKQLASLQRFFAKQRIRRVYSSPLARAVSTAAALGKPILVDALREINFGKAEGLSHEQTEQKYPRLFDEIFENPKKRFPQGESLEDVVSRVRPFLKTLESEKGNPTVVVVGHNMVNRVLLAEALGLPVQLGRAFKLKNASVAMVDLNPSHRRLYLLNNAIASVGKTRLSKV